MLRSAVPPMMLDIPDFRRPNHGKCYAYDTGRGALPRSLLASRGGVGVTLGTYSQFEGVILAAKRDHTEYWRNWYGRLLARTQVTLDANAVTQPAP